MSVFEERMNIEVITILNNKEKSIQMGENGRDYVHSNFAWDVIVDKYMKFFREVSGEKE